MAEVKFLPDGKSLDARPGETLLAAALRAGVPHAQACGGYGRCSTCRVLVTAGAEHCSPRGSAESEIAARLNFAPELRLACQTSAAGPVTVRRLVLDEADQQLTSLLRPDSFAGSAGLQREVAILFADVRGFTAFAEAHSPYDVIHVLNRYFQQVNPIVERHGGAINNYMGDGFMALFGLKDSRDAALRAVRAGWEILAAARSHHTYVRNLFNHAFRVGLGVHQGTVVVGAVGAQANQRVTAIGDAVNFASRIESENKPAGTEFLVSQACYDRVKTHVLPGRTVQVHIRGKTGLHPLYEIKGLA